MCRVWGGTTASRISINPWPFISGPLQNLECWARVQSRKVQRGSTVDLLHSVQRVATPTPYLGLDLGMLNATREARILAGCRLYQLLHTGVNRVCSWAANNASAWPRGE